MNPEVQNSMNRDEREKEIDFIKQRIQSYISKQEFVTVGYLIQILEIRSYQLGIYDSNEKAKEELKTT